MENEANDNCKTLPESQKAFHNNNEQQQQQNVNWKTL